MQPVVTTTEILVIMGPFFALVSIMLVGFAVQHYLDNR
jgi:hypothetical protein